MEEIEMRNDCIAMTIRLRKKVLFIFKKLYGPLTSKNISARCLVFLGMLYVLVKNRKNKIELNLCQGRSLSEMVAECFLKGNSCFYSKRLHRSMIAALLNGY